MVRSVFVHVPKTAGTSFRAALCAGFGEASVSPSFAATRISPEEAGRLAAYDVVAGHISMADVTRHFPHAATFTILREPIDRALSWYYYARMQAWGIATDVDAAKSHDVDAFFALDAAIVFRNIFNRQVRQLGDHVLNTEVDLDAALDRAKRALEACVWVGRQEHLDADLARLPAALPEMAGVAMATLNVTPERRSVREIDPALAEKIARYNRHDMELYAHACAMLGTPRTY
ncbi:sulfotransferase family 2 domain-containing protein [Azorhizobium doebereinerae]|uniref:sulfotransferase family 2 domain-containing protein n=1 Tax=Azorhizobium doebereinerae TaxID=281091 RepID=UPI0003FA10A9|nr:sulfotransferase family 2 domain-containing protein [Azorhizobium doebereinerae]